MIDELQITALDNSNPCYRTSILLYTEAMGSESYATLWRFAQCIYELDSEYDKPNPNFAIIRSTLEQLVSDSESLKDWLEDENQFQKNVVQAHPSHAPSDSWLSRISGNRRKKR